MANIDQTPFDENGKQHGEWIDHYDNDQLHFYEKWFHGVRHGVTKFYNYHGELICIGNFNMGIPIGYWYLHKQKKYYLCLI